MVSQKLGYWVDLRNVKFEESAPNTSWIEAMKAGTYHHAFYGDIEFSEERLRRFAGSVTTRVRGIDPDIDYDHKVFDGKAAGWVKDAKVELRDGKETLLLKVDWTDAGAAAIKNKEYRYFSPEFAEKWKDSQGTEFQDVLMGGGITNRPFLKNLVPLNLSELTFESPEPVPPKEEKEVDLKKLAELLGLPENTPEAEIYKAFGERLQPAPPPKVDPPADPPKPEPFQMSEELKKLAAANPVVGSLLQFVEGTVAENRDMQTALREAEVGAQLGELDKSKLILTPVARDAIKAFAMTLQPGDQSSKFWDIVRGLRDANAYLVELGERAGANVTYGKDKDPVKVFNDLTQEIMANDKLAYPDAVERAAKQDPTLYDAYRQASYSFNA